ncbi:MAG: hypothetical protein ACLFV4_14115, partial [Candidatus Hydrogenedentota bacterium]
MRRINFGAPGAPLPKAKALAWEEVRTAGAIAGAWTLVCIVYAILYRLVVGPGDWIQPVLTSLMFFAPVPVALLLVLNPNNAGHLAGGFPQRVLRLPVSVRMAAPIALFGRALLVFASAVLILAVNRLLFEGAPALSLALSYVLVYLIAQTVDWLRAPIQGLTTLLGVAALAGLAAAWGHWEYVLDGLHALREPGWGPGLLWTVAAAVLGYAISVAAVNATRTGRRMGIPELWEWPERLPRRSAPNLAPFSSPLAAQTWFELRWVGWVMPLTAIGLWALALGLIWLYAEHEVLRQWDLVAGAGLLLTTLFAAFVHALHSRVLGFRFKPGQIRFEYMRPMSSAHYASAKIRANALVFAPLLLAGLILMFPGLAGFRYLEILLQAVSLGAVSVREAFWALISWGVLFALMGWFLMALGTRLLRWFVGVLILSTLILGVGAFLASPNLYVWVHEALFEAVDKTLPIVIRGLQLGLIGLVIAAYGLACGKRLISFRALACWFTVWIGAAWLIRGPLPQPVEETFGIIPGPGFLNEALVCLFFASLIVLPYAAILFDINRLRHGAAVTQDPRQHESLWKGESAPAWRGWAMAGMAVVLVVWLGGPWEPAYKAYLQEQGAPATFEELDAYYEHVPDEENVALKYVDVGEDLRERRGRIEEELVPMVRRLVENDETGPSLGPGVPDAQLGPGVPDVQRDPYVRDYVYFVGGRRLQPGEPIDEDVWAITEAYWENMTSDVARELKRIAQDGPRPSRYPIDFPEGTPMSPQLPHLAFMRDHGRHLQLDALYWSVNGDAERAAKACLAILPLAESLAKDPVLISQHVRFDLLEMAMETLEIVLDRAPLTEEELRRTQEEFASVLAAYREEWMLRHALMGDRVMTLATGEGLYLHLRERYFHYLGQEDASPFLGLDWVVANLLIPVSGNQAPTLYYFSKVLDDPAEDLPRDGQEFKRMASPVRDMDTPLVSYFSRGAVPLGALGGEWRARTYLRLAQTAIAVERFRLEHERWPKDLGE